MERDDKKRYFSKSEPRTIVPSHQFQKVNISTHNSFKETTYRRKDMEYSSANSPGKYITLPSIDTQCIVVNLVNAVNIDVILNLTEEQKRIYGSVISKDISYKIIDPVSLTEGETINTLAYRARLGGIAVPNKGQVMMKKKLMSIATAQLRSYIMKTNGLFRCKISDIDVYHRVLIELYDPLTGSSLNEYILKKFHHILSPYTTPQVDFRMNKKFFGKYGSYSSSTCTDSEFELDEYEYAYMY